jgi:hypothetical protein
MSNHALIAPKFIAASPTKLVLKEKEGFISHSGMSEHVMVYQLLAMIAAEHS